MKALAIREAMAWLLRGGQLAVFVGCGFQQCCQLVVPLGEGSAHGVTDFVVGPSGGDHFLQDAHVVRGEIIIQIATGGAPFLRGGKVWVIECKGLTFEQAGIHVFEQGEDDALF